MILHKIKNLIERQLQVCQVIKHLESMKLMFPHHNYHKLRLILVPSHGEKRLTISILKLAVKVDHWNVSSTCAYAMFRISPNLSTTHKDSRKTFWRHDSMILVNRLSIIHIGKWEHQLIKINLTTSKHLMLWT